MLADKLSFEPQHVGLMLLAAAVTAIVSYVLRALVFHPLAKFPGPKLAALTSMYEDYFEVTNGNYDYLWQYKKLHNKYGPIVRISPHEIHIDDPDFYATLNSFKGQWDKDYHTAAQFGNPGSSVGTVDHDLHKRRRAAILPFFSKQKIYQLEEVIVGKAMILVNELNKYRESQAVVPMRQALKCYCVDTVSDYCFGRSGNMMQQPEFAVEHWRNFAKGLDAGLQARYMPKWFLPSVQKAPSWLQASLGPGVQHFDQWHRDVQDSVDHVQANAKSDASEVSEHRTIFHELLNSPHLPEEDKSRMRLVQEGAAMVGAGGESTSQVLSIVLYGLLENPDMLRRLRAELETLEIDPTTGIPSLRVLETMPYLTGCIKEGLRLRSGKVARQQRVPKKKSIFYKDIEIPAGTICSMTPVLVHVTPTIFAQPHAYRPERWADSTEDERQAMDKYMVPYSKGTRMCSGMTLANAMIYVGIATLVLKLDMQLYESSAWDNEQAVDTEKHAPLKNSKGLRVLVTGTHTPGAQKAEAQPKPVEA